MGGWARARAGAPGPVVGGAVVVGGVSVARVVVCPVVPGKI